MNGNNLSPMMQMNALMVEVEGMKAANAYRLADGATIAYDEHCFYVIATQLKELANFTTSE